MDSEVAESKKYSRCKLIGIRQCALCGVDVPIYHKDRWERKNIFCCKKHEGEFRRLHNPNYFPCCVLCLWENGVSQTIPKITSLYK